MLKSLQILTKMLYYTLQAFRPYTGIVIIINYVMKMK